MIQMPPWFGLRGVLTMSMYNTEFTQETFFLNFLGSVSCENGCASTRDKFMYTRRFFKSIFSIIIIFIVFDILFEYIQATS